MKKPSAEREFTRVARFLARGGAKLRVAIREGNLLLDGGGDRGVISVRRQSLQSMMREETIVLEGTDVRLTEAGYAFAKRHSAALKPFLAQHHTLGVKTVETAGGRVSVIANLSESPLAQLARRRTKHGQPFLSAAELRAGERLRSDYTRGRIMPRLGANWVAAVSSGRRADRTAGAVELTDAALAARQRVEQALTAVGPELSGVLIDVCCFLKGLERVEIERGWPARSAKVVLKTALGALSRHYEPPSGGRGKGYAAILHWGTEDYRPSIHGE